MHDKPLVQFLHDRFCRALDRHTDGVRPGRRSLGHMQIEAASRHWLRAGAILNAIRLVRLGGLEVWQRPKQRVERVDQRGVAAVVGWQCRRSPPGGIDHRRDGVVVGVAERVDALLWVAHRHKSAVRPGQLLKHPPLGCVGVLRLVEDDQIPSVMHTGRERGATRSERTVDDADKIIEVDDSEPRFAILQPVSHGVREPVADVAEDRVAIGSGDGRHPDRWLEENTWLGLG